MMQFRIYLRALEPNDYLVTIEWRHDEEITNMVGGHKYFVSREKERRWVLDAIDDNNRMILGICLKDDDRLIGTVNIQDIDWINRSAHIPILIGDKTMWGKGYATEARFLALRFAFEERGMHRIWALVLENNIGSLKMHEQCGYKKEGTLIDSLFKAGKYQNQIYLGLLKEDYEKAFNLYCVKHNS